MRGLTILLLMLAILMSVKAVFFFIDEGKTYCFYEDINEDTQLLITYKIPQLDDALREQMHLYEPKLVHLHDIGIDTVVKDPFGKQILKQNLGDKEGVVHFRSAKDVSGLYEICFKTNTSHWFGGNQKIEFHLKIELDFESREYGKVESKQRVDKITDLVQSLQNMVEYVANDQIYFKNREERFQETSGSTSTRVFLVGMVQLVMCLAVGSWQLWSLQRYFKQKKIV